MPPPQQRPPPPPPHLVILWLGLQEAVLLNSHGWRQRHRVCTLLALLLSAALHARRTGLWQSAAGQAFVSNPLHAKVESNRLTANSLPTEGKTDRKCTHLLHRLVLRRRGAVVRVFLGRHGHLPALSHVSALFVFVREFLHVAVCLAAA